MITATRTRAFRILDIDIENRPLSYLGQDFTTAEITAIAASFGPDEPMFCYLLGRDDPLDSLMAFHDLYDRADMVTGHYCLVHDLPIINGTMLEYGLEPLGPKTVCDTKIHLRKRSGVSASQESLADMLGLQHPKIPMSQLKWRAANRLTPEGIAYTETRVTGDVRQHQELRVELASRGMLSAPTVWRP